MSFTIYCIICTIIAGIYFSVIFAMDVTGKGKKETRNVEEFNTVDDMGEEDSVVIQETSLDGEYKILQDTEDTVETDEKDYQQIDSGSESSQDYNCEGNQSFDNKETSPEEGCLSGDEDLQEQIVSDDSVQDQAENLNIGQEYVDMLNSSIADKCEPIPQQYQELLSSEEYRAFILSRHSQSSDIKIINVLDKV